MDKNDKDIIEIDLSVLIYELLRQWWLFLLFGIIGGALVFIGTHFLITPMYESQAMLYVLSETVTSDSTYSDFQISNALTSDFEIIATSDPVIEGAIEYLEEEYGVVMTTNEVMKNLSVMNAGDTRILVINVKYEDPIIACLLVNAIVDEMANQMIHIMQMNPPTIVESAKVAKNPVSPNIIKNTTIGILVGIFLAVAYFVFKFIKNDNIKTQEDIEKYLGLSTLAIMPLQKEMDMKKKEKNTMKRREKRKKR